MPSYIKGQCCSFSADSLQYFWVFFPNLPEPFPQTQTMIIRLVIAYPANGEISDEDCIHCGLLSFGLGGSIYRAEVGHQILWKFVELYWYLFSSLKRY